MFNLKLLIHFDLSKKLFVKEPIIIPDTKPVINIGNPIYLAPDPNNSVAKNICTRLLVNAPNILIPTMVTRLFNKKYTSNIIIPLEIEPEREYKKTQLNMVPVTSDEPIDFIKINRSVPFGVNKTRDNSIGIFAKPNLRNGIGFGIIYSIIDKKSDSAPNIDITLSLSE